MAEFQPSKRRFLKTGVLAGAGAALGVLAYTSSIGEPHHPVAEHIHLRLARLPESFHGFRIAQLSDIHWGPYIGRATVERAVRQARGFDSDLVVLTGDFVSHPLGETYGVHGARHAEPCADVLVQLAPAPLLAVLGNHDHWNDATIVSGALSERGIRVLRNQSFVVERGGERLWIAGIDDSLVRASDLASTLRGIPAAEPVLLLAHEPDFADYAAKFPIDLQLSGHSHGGQVRLPGLGAPILPAMAVKYPMGWARVGGLQVYTSRGVGVISPPVRFNCPPEVTLITLLCARG